MAAPATIKKKEWKHSAIRMIHKRVRDPIRGRSPENRLHNNSSIRITRVKIKPKKYFKNTYSLGRFIYSSDYFKKSSN